ncbi:dolichyl-phosphate-mannose--protein mannosyltransferase [Aeromicrobium terrae]|uniref:dolichyl-phosphate-mannose--protein mannosyltransferase n=1 Tax=Aeromicrobium terrae TaxID=2498846 RepID=UPI0016504C65|nr:phospholipid carrier-dependent glycosyltransferase [Aeromicrobium terrae]
MRVSERAWGWLAPVGVTLFAFGLRLYHLGRPDTLAFDETYYAKHAWSMLQNGYVQDYVDNANERIIDGHTTHLMIAGQPTEIVHPEAGKWFIALGEWAFGLDPVGWRIASAVAGALMVLVLARMVRRLTGSTWIGCLAGFLLAMDGAQFVLSRLALLDIFVAFWLVCAVACLVADHDWILERLDRYRVIRPWQVGAGICFGLACGTKWSGVYTLAAFGLLVVLWEVVARRRAGRPALTWQTLAVGVPAFVTLVGIAFLVYLATWTGWLMHHGPYDTRFSLGHGSGFWDSLRSLWRYHERMYDFHTGEYLKSQHHPYASQAWGWLVLDRPVSVDVTNNVAAAKCGAPKGSGCIREVLILGNPAVWWPAAAASLAAVVAWVKTRDGRWAVPVLGVLTAWAPWLLFGDRPIFSYYAIAALPFMIVALCLVIDLIRRHVTTPRGVYGVWLGCGMLVTAVVAAFWYFHPILVGDLITYDAWRDRMWFDRWI